MATSMSGLMYEVGLAGFHSVVVSTSVPHGKRVGPISENEYRALDHGVALWFKRAEDGEWLCIACDRFERPSGNMRAIALIVEGRRREERYGTDAMIESSWNAFAVQALPARVEPRLWFEILGVLPSAPIETCEAVYRSLAKSAHPDAGGSSERMAELNRAIEEARNR